MLHSKLVSTAWLILFLLVSSCGQEGPHINHYTVTGTVTDSQAGNAIPNIQVEVFTPSGNLSTTLATSSDGTYSFRESLPSRQLAFWECGILARFKFAFSDIDGESNGGNFKPIEKEIGVEAEECKESAVLDIALEKQ